MPRGMRKLVGAGIVACIFALLVAMFPLAVMAQASAFDDENRATVVAIVQRVAGTVNPSATSESGAVEVPSEEDVEASPVPQNEGAASEPGSEVTELPELDLTDLVEYSSQGVSILVPADWIVEPDLDDNTPFMIEVPGTNLIVSLSSDSGLNFPSWLGVALFRSQADLLVQDMGEDAQLEESTTLYTEQNLPAAKLAFSGTDNGEEIGGAIYAVAPNEDAYMVIAGGSADEWAYAKPGVDLIVESIIFDDDLLDVQFAGEEPLTFTDADETVQVTVPANWYAMSTGDPQFPIILAEPEVRYIAAVGTEEVFGKDFDASVLDQFMSDEGEVDPEQYENLIDEIGVMISDSGSPITVDEELSKVIPREGAAMVRLVGDAELNGDLSMPVILYVDLRDSGLVVASIFGDIESAVELEEELQALVESVTGL